jgi:hypothetical protein
LLFIVCVTGFTGRERLPTVARAGVLAVAITAMIATTSPPLGAVVSPSNRACPPGHSVVPTSVGLLCAHDLVHGVPVGTRASAVRPAKPRCYGDGMSGDRVQLLYVYAAGRQIRGAISDRIVRTIVPGIEGLVRGRSRAQGKELGVRFQMPGCKLRVDLVELSGATLRPGPTVDDQTGRIIDGLSSLGYKARDRKYLVWVDAESGPSYPNARGTGPCGIATIAGMDTGPFPNPFDQPTPTNYHNGLVPLYALAFATNFALLGGTPCWGGSNGADTESHELFHTLGAVQLSAPNSNGFGHCTDVPDLMCYPEHGVGVRQVCPGYARILDCGGDDYFNVNPPQGSYLATHWNTARSSFIGDSLLDGVPVKVPRTP